MSNIDRSTIFVLYIHPWPFTHRVNMVKMSGFSHTLTCYRQARHLTVSSYVLFLTYVRWWSQSCKLCSHDYNFTCTPSFGEFFLVYLTRVKVTDTEYGVQKYCQYIQVRLILGALGQRSRSCTKKMLALFCKFLIQLYTSWQGSLIILLLYGAASVF